MSGIKKERITAWIVLLVAFLGGVALSCTQNKIPPCIDAVMLAFDIDMVLAGWLTSVFAVMGMLTAIPASSILNRMGPRKCGLLSLCFAGVGAVLGAFSTTAGILMVSRIIEGMGVGIIAVVVPSLIAMWFPEDKRGLPMGVWTAWMPTGQSLVFLVGGGISFKFGWQGVWWFTFILCVVAFILYFWKVDAPPTDKSYAVLEEVKVSYLEGIKSKNLVLILLCGICFAICSFAFATWITSFWTESFGIDVNTANTWVSIIYIVEIGMCSIVGIILNHAKSIKIVGAVGFALYGILGFLAFTITDTGIVIPMIILWALAEALAATSLWTLAPSFAQSPEYISFNVGVLSVGLNLGILIGPPFGGFLITSFGWKAIAICLAIVCAAGAILLMLSSSKNKKPQND